MRSRAQALIQGERSAPLYRHGRQVGTRIAPDRRLMLSALQAFYANRDGLANRMPHRQRLSVADFQDLMLHPERDPRFDRGAIDLPWFDHGSVLRGRTSIDAACRDARMVEAAIAAIAQEESNKVTRSRNKLGKSPRRL